jgi:hypothetical protein
MGIHAVTLNLRGLDEISINDIYIYIYVYIYDTGQKKKGKAIPVTGHGGP